MSTIDIEIQEGDYEIDDDGTVTFALDPGYYGLIPEDEIEDHIDVDDFLQERSDDELIDELEKRDRYYIEENFDDYAHKRMEGTPNDRRIFLTNLLGISHLASKEEILNKISELI